jgi:putative N-acetylmannosamine-6-phosphate epimerase
VNYATWKLNFTDPNYGTGPEAKIAELGYSAEGAWLSGDIVGGTIMGYVTQPQDESELTDWDFQNITEAEALAFCQAIVPEAYIDQDGRITAPSEA